MDVGVIMELVGSLGFPIAVSGYLLYSTRLTEKEHREGLEKLADAIRENTEMVKELSVELRLTRGGD